jgi:DNA processing protein
MVVEAAARSGALITARLASEYNREVFAIPGRLQDPMSIGTNALIRDGGAKLVTCVEDVLDELGDVGRSLKRGEPAGQSAKPSSAAGTTQDAKGRLDFAAGQSLSVAERRVYEIVAYDPLLTDAVISASGLPPGEVLAALTALELKGLVKRLPGNLVVRRGVA